MNLEFQCPQCGYKIGDKRNYNSLIVERLQKYSEPVRTLIKKISKEIVHALPSENNISLYFFLLRLEYDKMDEWSIKKGIDTYMYNEYHKKGKGFSYLTAIIANLDTNKESVIKYEKERIGSTPPVKKIK